MPPANPPRPGGIIASWSGTAYSTRQVWLISQLTSISEGLSPIRHPGTRLVGDGRPTTELEVAYSRSKRLGTALCNLVSDCKKCGIKLGGCGRGRLTGNTIKKLQIFFIRAVRGSCKVEDMQKAIYASLFHGYSTNASPRIRSCCDFCTFWKLCVRIFINMGIHPYCLPISVLIQSNTDG